MHDTDVTLESRSAARAEVRVCRLDGSEVAVRLRLLGYDGCEFESFEEFATGESISIHVYRMGWIRARVLSQRSGMVEAEFDKDCPV
jgi:hypothetical protein